MGPFFNPFMMHSFVKKPARVPPPPQPEPVPEPRPIDEVINPPGRVHAAHEMIGGRAVERNPSPAPFQPTLAPLRPAAEQAMGAVGGAFNSASRAGSQGMEAARIRMAQLMRQRSDEADELEAMRQTPPEPAPEEDAAPVMNDRRAQYMRNDFLRRMAVRHEAQMAQAGLGYEHLENEYDSGQGGHYDRAASMTQGLLNRLRAAREMDSAKRVRDRAEQDNMARRLGVNRAGVIFHDDLQNAQTPEDRIRVALSYHAMFPELGLGNMAAMMASQAGENQNLQTAGDMQSREAAAQREFASQEANNQRMFAGQEAGDERHQNLILALQQQAAALQQQQSAQNSQMAMQAGQNASNERTAGIVAQGQENAARGQGAEAAMAGAQAAAMNSPMAQMAQMQQNISSGPNPIASILADYQMQGGLPDPRLQQAHIVRAGQPRAAQVAAQKQMGNQDKLFLKQWTDSYFGGQQPSAAKYAEWARMLMKSPEDPLTQQLFYDLTGVNPGGFFGGIRSVMGSGFGTAAGAMINPVGAAASAAAGAFAR